jgi:hypothetical protein
MRDASKRVAKSLFLIAPKLRVLRAIRPFRISNLVTRINDQMRDASKRVAKSLLLIAPKLCVFKSIRAFRISNLVTRINDQIRDASKRDAKSSLSIALRILNPVYSNLSTLFVSRIPFTRI